MGRITNTSPGQYVVVGAAGYTIFRTGAPFLAIRATPVAILLGSLLAILGFGWVVALLVVAVKRRHRTKWQTAGEFTIAIALGYVLSVIATTPLRVQLDPSQTLAATLPLLALATSIAIIIILPVSATIITFFRRRDKPSAAGAPPA